jgi:prolyl-tRNA synthetase
MLDDRSNVSAGVKFKDAELLGSPWRITVGRQAENGIIELTQRGTGETTELEFDRIDVFLARIKETYEQWV